MKKAMWDWMDVQEGKKAGTSFGNMQKERVRQGYKNEKVKVKAYEKNIVCSRCRAEFDSFAELWRNKHEYKHYGGK